jgi:hypothetical protein
MASGNGDRTYTPVGVVCCIKGISLVGINYMEIYFLSWIGGKLIKN